MTDDNRSFDSHKAYRAFREIADASIRHDIREGILEMSRDVFLRVSDDKLAAEIERQLARYRTAHPPTPEGEPVDTKVGVLRRDDGRIVLAIGEIGYDFDVMTAYDIGNLLIDASGFTPTP